MLALKIKVMERDKMTCVITPCLELPAKNPRTTIVIPPDLKADFERLCEMEDRSFSNYVVHLIRQTVEKAKADGRLEVGECNTEGKS